ncbi:hypothetical protein EON80_23605 [bacterium]|nr:MAG: hypothetical protein EON80_23605 [bacterium]
MNDHDQIPEERVFLYYLGNFIIVVGILLFISVFFTGMSTPTHFGSPPPEFKRAIFGMGMMVVGGILSGIGRAGMAGSGIVLDP